MGGTTIAAGTRWAIAAASMAQATRTMSLGAPPLTRRAVLVAAALLGTRLPRHHPSQPQRQQPCRRQHPTIQARSPGVLARSMEFNNKAPLRSAKSIQTGAEC